MAATVDETPADSTGLNWLWIAAAIVFSLLLIAVGIDDLRLRIHQKTLLATLASRPAAPVLPAPLPSGGQTEPWAPFASAPAADAVTATPAPSPPAAVVPEVPATAPAIRPALPPPGPFAALEAVHPYRTPSINPNATVDAQIGTAIRRGVGYLLSQFAESGLRNADAFDADTYAGLDTLCVYALLHAGQAIDDPRLRPQSELMKPLIERMKLFPNNGSRSTYSRSLRISALTLYNRTEDRDAIENDYQWLLKNVVKGSYTYQAMPPKQPRPPELWDNSNSQYGALGMWAASEAGLRPLGTYWEEVMQHWDTCQTHSGGWAYSPGSDNPTLAMTAAGVSILFAARDQTAADAGISESPPPPLSRSIELGLEWLDEGDHCTDIPAGHPGYTLYGLERAGLASGLKFFGNHDWYSELAQQSIAQQQPDGSWVGGDGDVAETAFRLLFLARGRHPIFINKLRYDGDWAYRPRDAANLVHFASQQLERPLNWQIVGLQRGAVEWSDCPVLFISGSQAPQFSDDDVAKLHEFVEMGGMLFTQSIKNSTDFDHFAADLARRLYPELALSPLSPTHPLFSSMFAIQPDQQATLSGLSNGARLLMVHAHGDLSRFWHPRYEKRAPAALQLATDVVVYATGRQGFLNRTGALVIPQPTSPPLASFPIARLRYGGGSQANWDPEPGAWKRMCRLMQFNTGVRPELLETDLDKLDAHTAPLAYLTGVGTSQFTEAQIAAARKYISDGGVLFIDSCGGSRAFADSVRKGLIDPITGETEIETISAAHPLLNRSGEAMLDLTHPRFRLFDWAADQNDAFQCRIAHIGKGDLIFTPLDVTTGLLGTSTWGIRGFQPDYAQGLVNNLILWTMRTAGRIDPR